MVAETEHLPTAARALGVSAPGLSRTLKLLE
jgi:DNA-binding transcriptional LysR family regulator